MDKNQILGIFLIFALLAGYTYVNAPSPEQIAEQERIQDSIEMAQKVAPVSSPLPNNSASISPVVAISDSAKIAQFQGTMGVFANAGIGTESSYTLENELISVVFTNKGGIVKEATLKNFKKLRIDSTGTESTTVRLMEDEKNKFEYLLPIANAGNGILKTSALYFTANQSGNSITFTAQASNGASFQQKYTLNQNSYNLDYEISMLGFDQVIDPNSKQIQLNWVNHLDKIENNRQFEKRYSTVYFKESAEGSADYCSCTGDDDETISSKVDWVSNVHQFFNTSLVAKNNKFSNAEVSTEMLDDSAEDIKILRSNIGIPFGQSSNETFAMQMYIGPNEYNNLNKYENSLEEIIPFGISIVGTINRHVIRPFFNFLSQFIGSKGIVIIVLIFIIKMLLYPLMYKMLHSQAKMAALKPEITKLTDKFKDEPQKKQMETMKIYREYGVSPLGGCMPMVLQMPIWYALFRFFPASITFRQEPFLWATDLSSFDMFFKLPFELPLGMGAHISLFTLLWAVTTLLYTYYNTKHMDMSANPAMKYVQYLMPMMFLGFFNSYASGLTCYMFFSNIFNILQTVITKKFVFKDEKILAELNKQKAKPKKTSAFQERLQEAMRQQQAAQQKRKK